MIDNPYWDAVKDRIDRSGSLWRTPSVDGLGMYRRPNGDFDVERWSREALNRREFTKRYSWTIPDPATLAFVVEHSARRIVDPMAGTGYWGWLLAQSGVDVVSYDEAPTINLYHEGQPLHCTVTALDGVNAVKLHADRTLLLSWPPMDSSGADILHAYRGSRVIHIGEPEGGCTGDDDLFDLLRKKWREIAECVPVQWDGIHDVVTVYEREG